MYILTFDARQLASPENHQIPADIVSAWKQAVSANSRMQKNQVFQAFLKAGKNWGVLLVSILIFARLNACHFFCTVLPRHAFVPDHLVHSLICTS